MFCFLCVVSLFGEKNTVVNCTFVGIQKAILIIMSYNINEYRHKNIHDGYSFIMFSDETHVKMYIMKY
jgi:hypothetical protein